MGYLQLSEHETTELDLFRLYLDEVGRHPLLTKRDEVELSQAYEAGLEARRQLVELPPGDRRRERLEQVAASGEQARRKMIESNLRLTVGQAREAAGDARLAAGARRHPRPAGRPGRR